MSRKSLEHSILACFPFTSSIAVIAWQWSLTSPTAQDYFQRGLNKRISLSSSLVGPRCRAGNQSDEDAHRKATDQTKMRKQNKAGSVCCGGHQEGSTSVASQIPFFCSFKLNCILLWNNVSSIIKFWTIRKKILLYLFTIFQVNAFFQNWIEGN